MRESHLNYALGGFTKDFIRFLYQRNRMRSQKIFCWCPGCRQDLCSSGSFVMDKKLVSYKCVYCKCVSKWNFDMAPGPILRYYIPDGGKVITASPDFDVMEDTIEEFKERK